MKRILLLFMLLAAVLSCSACSAEEPAQPAFYYLRAEDSIVYGQEDALILPVPQEISPEADLDALLQLYLDGPTVDDLRSPIPKGTCLLSATEQENTLVVVLSREFSEADGIQLTLACACLTATCHDLTGMEKIEIRSGENTYIFDINSFIFLDNSAEK